MELKQLRFLKHLFRTGQRVYLDHNATTPVSRHVQFAMNRVLKKNYGNPSSIYGIARESNHIIEKARQQVADAIHADASEIIFTGCATESNNAILKSVSHSFLPVKNKIISTPLEHPSVMRTLEFLKTQGIRIEFCPVDSQGRLQISELEKMIDDKTSLICCMLANNEIGTIQEIPAIAKLAREHQVLVMSDCVQALGKIAIDVHAWDLDYASFSAHKLYGPKGIGAVYVKKGNPFTPLLHGGHQENGMRGGTESIHNIAGFGAACADVNGHLLQAEKIRILKGRLEQEIRKIKPDCIVNSPAKDCLPNTLSISFPGLKNDSLMAVLDNNGIAVSAGSACSSHELKHSDTLKAIGLSDTAAEETIRFSLGKTTSGKDIRYTAQIVHDYIEGRLLLVNTIAPAQANEVLLFDEKNYILDVRPQAMRHTVTSLPNSHEISFAFVEKYLPRLPRNKNILVVCQRGNLANVVAYYLKSKGFEHVSVLLNGVCGWKELYPDLYRKYAGQNRSVLDSRG